MRFSFFTLLCLCIVTTTIHSQSLDNTFNPIFETPAPIFAGVFVGDDDLVVQGNIKRLSGASCGSVVKINKNGLLHPDFNSENGIDGQAYDMIAQPDGKIIMSGIFTDSAGKLRLLVRINSNGTVDNTFSPSPNEGSDGQPGFGYLYSLAIQSTGNLLVGGSFVNFNRVLRKGIVRLNSNGSIDETFNAGLTSDVQRLAVQSDDKILIFANNTLQRLNADGTTDNTFTAVNFNGTVNAIDFQDDGRIIVGGLFTQVNNTNSGKIARINTNGSFDNTFFPSGSFSIMDVQKLTVSSDNKVTAIGNFSKGILRLTSSGAIDPTFQILTGFDAQAVGVSIPNFNFVGAQTDGAVVVGGYFSTVDSSPRLSLARILANGNLDVAYQPRVAGSSGIQDIVPTSDGKLLVAGRFVFVNGQHSPGGIVRLNDNGTTDPTFNVSALTWVSGYVKTIGLYPDGKVMLGGNFYVAPNGLPGTTLRGLIRLTSGGVYDASFNQFSGINAPWDFTDVSDLIIEQDEKVIIGGSFWEVNSTERKYLARINTNGSLDPTFHENGSAYTDWIVELTKEDGGKILVRSNDNGGSTQKTVQLANSDGSPDVSLDLTGKFDNQFVYTAVFTPDDKLLLGGSFGTFNGAATPGLVKISRSGIQDETFAHQNNAISIYKLLITKSNKILAGLQTDANHASAFIVLHEDGTIFPTTVEIKGTINDIVSDAGNNFYLSGTSLTVGGIEKGELLRYNVGVAQHITDLSAEAVGNKIVLSWNASTNTSSVYEIERSTSPNTNFEFHTYSSTPLFVDSLELNTNVTYYYRIREVTINNVGEFSGAVSALVTGIEDGLQGDISAYPNPFNKTFFLQNNSSEVMDAYFFNYQGKEIYRTQLLAGSKTEVGNVVAPGMYFIKVTQSARQSVLKMVKE